MSWILCVLLVLASSMSSTYREGSISQADLSHGSNYLAVPWGRGVWVRICAATCVVMRSTDACPDLAMQRGGRIADLAIGQWLKISGLPASRGLVAGSIERVGAPKLPPTDTVK